jgi:hypothetical protein
VQALSLSPETSNEPTFSAQNGALAVGNRCQPSAPEHDQNFGVLLNSTVGSLSAPRLSIETIPVRPHQEEPKAPDQAAHAQQKRCSNGKDIPTSAKTSSMTHKPSMVRQASFAPAQLHARSTSLESLEQSLPGRSQTTGKQRAGDAAAEGKLALPEEPKVPSADALLGRRLATAAQSQRKNSDRTDHPSKTASHPKYESLGLPSEGKSEGGKPHGEDRVEGRTRDFAQLDPSSSAATGASAITPDGLPEEALICTSGQAHAGTAIAERLDLPSAPNTAGPSSGSVEASTSNRVEECVIANKPAAPTPTLSPRNGRLDNSKTQLTDTNKGVALSGNNAPHDSAHLEGQPQTPLGLASGKVSAQGAFPVAASASTSLIAKSRFGSINNKLVELTSYNDKLAMPSNNAVTQVGSQSFESYSLGLTGSPNAPAETETQVLQEALVSSSQAQVVSLRVVSEGGIARGVVREQSDGIRALLLPSSSEATYLAQVQLPNLRRSIEALGLVVKGISVSSNGQDFGQENSGRNDKTEQSNSRHTSDSKAREIFLTEEVG